MGHNVAAAATRHTLLYTTTQKAHHSVGHWRLPLSRSTTVVVLSFWAVLLGFSLAKVLQRYGKLWLWIPVQAFKCNRNFRHTVTVTHHGHSMSV